MNNRTLEILMMIQIVISAIAIFGLYSVFSLVWGVTSIYKAYQLMSNHHSRNVVSLLSEVFLFGAMYEFYKEVDFLSWCFLLIAMLLSVGIDGFKDMFNERDDY
jgi:uncharacterized membrane protein